MIGFSVRVMVFNIQQYFSYIVEISFIGGGIWSTEEATDLSHVIDKFLSHNVVVSTPRYERDSNSQHKW